MAAIYHFPKNEMPRDPPVIEIKQKEKQILTKLSQNTRAGTILQLCLYSELIAKIQGVMPEFTFVVKPGKPFEIERFRVDDFLSYYRLVKNNLESSLVSTELESTYPDAVEHCDVCRWWTRCNEIRRADDHLTFIAGISKSQIAELRRQGVNSLESFASSSQPLAERPKRGSASSYEKIHRQAKLQLKARQTGNNLIEFNPLEEDRGFCLRPEPNQADVYFDLEGDPHVSGGVLEYLFGCAMRDGDATQFHHVWCLNRADEKTAFMDFMKFLMDRWASNPDFHIYHYAPYEPAALKRLAMRYAAFESDLDRLLRAEKFIDLYAVTRQSMTLSVERYSIKNLEAFYKYERLEELANVRPALHRVERALELSLPDEIQETDKTIVCAYNQDDCVSTFELHKWLESKRHEFADSGVHVPRPERRYGEATERVAELEQEFKRCLMDLLKELTTLRKLRMRRQGGCLLICSTIFGVKINVLGGSISECTIWSPKTCSTKRRR